MLLYLLPVQPSPPVHQYTIYTSQPDIDINAARDINYNINY